jgi:hypothetical protein
MLEEVDDEIATSCLFIILFSHIDKTFIMN